MGDRMKGPEGPGKKGNQPQNESEADFHSGGLAGFGVGGNGVFGVQSLATYPNIGLGLVNISEL